MRRAQTDIDPVKRFGRDRITDFSCLYDDLLAKSQISKIVIKGADLSAPIEITKPKTLADSLSGGYMDRLLPLRQVRQSRLTLCGETLRIIRP